MTDIVFASSQSRTVTGKVSNVNVGKNEITVNGEVYKLGADGEVYDATDAKGSDYSVEGLRDVDVNDTVTLVLSASGSKFVDIVTLVNPTKVTGVLTAPATATAGDTVTISVADADLNTDATSQQTVTVTVGSDTVTLTETSAFSGVFTGTYATTQAGTLTVTYVDAADANGQSKNTSTTITVATAN